jgi:ATP-dependent helicase Lhr and Lhr-like helicase
MPVAQFHPLVVEWFSRRFGAPTEPQTRAWPELQAGRHVLICAPTGSGKTLAAFLVCLDRLVRAALDGTFEDRIEAVYVSPLKALSNDIRKNLDEPLREIAALAAEKGMPLPPIRTAVRTGDTRAWERQQMLRQPPHILVTTPESLFILLTAERSRAALRTARTVILDEIHAVVDDKRGAHLALSIARLQDLIERAGGQPPQRIGLSATVRPVEEVAAFLAHGTRPDAKLTKLAVLARPESVRNGHILPCKHGRARTGAPPPERIGDHGDPASDGVGGPGGAKPPGLELDSTIEGGSTTAQIIDSGHRRPLDVAVEVPRDELGAVATNEMWAEIYDRLAELIRAHCTTLVFVNTRRLAERVSHHLAERLGEDAVLAHHGSLSRQLRLTAEERLKQGRLRAVVATASLELGIDIGSIDLVCQIGSPRSIAVTLQRIGRSGHHAHAASVPKGRIFATTRDELIECAALVRAIRAGTLDRLEIPPWPLDVLAQQIVAGAACEPWAENDLFALVRRAYPYRDLPRRDFDAVVAMLSDGIATARGRSGAFLHRDQVNGLVRGRRGARLAAITSGGAIPDNANYFVVAEPEGTIVGTLDEDFAVESMAGDVFLLGTTSWRIRRVEAGRVRVEDAHGAAPSIPFWRGEAPGRTAELSAEVARVREEVIQADGPDGALEFLTRACGLDRLGAEQAALYVRSGAAALGALPTNRTLVAERFFDESGGMQLVLHAPLGARINRAWGLALRKRFCRSFNFELQAAATDNGIVISLSDQHSFPLDAVFRFLSTGTVEDVLTQAMLDAPLFTARWRWNASRALAVLRFAGGRKVPPPIQRMRSDDLLAAVFPDQVACAENLVGDIRIPDHPLVNETIRDCLHEAMDLEGLETLLEGIARGDVRTVAIDTPEPSPFSHEILNANPYAYLDDAPLEERRARAVQMRRTLGADAGDIGALDPAAIQEVAEESWPVVRDADELHDALLTLVVLPPVSEWTEYFEELTRKRRAATLRAAGLDFWVAAERLVPARLLYPGATVVPPMAAIDSGVPAERESAATEVVRGWLESTGPSTASQLAGRLAIGRDLVGAALARLESEGQILRGRFTPGGVGLPLARSVRLPLAGSVRLQADPDAGSVRLPLAAQADPDVHLPPSHEAPAVAELRRVRHGLGEVDSANRRSLGGGDQGDLEKADAEVEWCNRRLLARIHRLTLGRLRREIQPVTAAEFVRFLFRWQHLEPGTQLHGVDGALQIVRQLQGYEISAAAWETDVLPRRITRYSPDLLDQLCLSGEVMWGRLSPHPAFEVVDGRADPAAPGRESARGAAADPARPPEAGVAAPVDETGSNGPARRRVRPTRVAPLTIFQREDAPWLLDSGARPEISSLGASLSHPAQDVLEALGRRGASFVGELVQATRRLPSEVEDALWELAAAGLVTADGFENLRALVDPKRRRGEGRERLRRPRHAAGRWALLSPPDGGAALSIAERAEALARQLLLRWGVVFRDLLARETLNVPWRDLLIAFRRLEARGEIRGGRFVDGFLGEQFARPEAIDALRGVRRMEPLERPLRIAAADPLNLAGILIPGPRVSALAGHIVEVLPAASPAAEAV